MEFGFLGNYFQTWLACYQDKQLTIRINVILSSLTKREKQVVDEVIKGATNKQVAQVLNITERTVKEHMSSIFHKLKVRDRMQLMLAVKGH
ncbi:response regulator transcription factor [Pseudoalteromonas sp. GB43]